MISKKGISVLVCTYNGANQILKSLYYLLNQLGLEKIDWEIIVVDNASTDDTYSIVSSYIKEETLSNIFLYQQPLKGKLQAIRLAVEKANYSYLIICDDDNWLCNDYFSRVYNIFENNDKIGIIGGNGSPSKPSEIPDWAIPHLHNYAAYKQWEFTSDITSEVGSVYGAGMAIRKYIYSYVLSSGWPLYLSAIRKTNNLSTGEDTEICLIARLLGYRVFYDQNLIFKHNISLNRINKPYLIKLSYFLGYATAIMLPYYENYIKAKNKPLVIIFSHELYRLIKYNLWAVLTSFNFKAKKDFNFRLGYLKSILVNYSKISKLREFINQHKY